MLVVRTVQSAAPLLPATITATTTAAAVHYSHSLAVRRAFLLTAWLPSNRLIGCERKAMFVSFYITYIFEHNKQHIRIY